LETQIKYFREMFEEFTGFSPYKYQENCFNYISNCRSIILQAPTGSGKTLASILPFLFNWIQWKNGDQIVNKFPRKLIYSLPLRALANSLYKDVSEMMEKYEFIEKPKITLQTGEYSDDIFFEGDIIFTTIDQTLSNILSIPLSLPNKLSNINAGAVLSSYLVFDEFHLLEPQKSLSTSLIILNKIKNIIPFCLMTATLTELFLDKISSMLNCKKIQIDKDDYQNFTFIKENQKRVLNALDEEITAEKIMTLHQNKTIIICNTVGSCSQKAKDVMEILEKDNNRTKLICLHSQFFSQDRKKKEEEILEYFGKYSNYKNAILITTQIIEVGLDISCDTMLTEVSPINSFLQRVGRSARWGGQSSIYVFNQAMKLPYKMDLSEKTFCKLTEYNEKILDTNTSNELISEILTDLEESIYKQITESSELTWESIIQSWQTGNKGLARELIRDIHSINIVLVEESQRIQSLYEYDSISMNPFSLRSQLKKVTENYEGEIPQIAFTLQPSSIFDDEEDENMELTPISIDKIDNENIIALNSEYVGYSELTGLDFTGNYNVLSELKEKRNDTFKIRYIFDTFEEHNRWMIEVFKEMYTHQYPISRIQENYYREFDFNKVITFMILGHDLGKLNDKWQEIVQKYQNQKVGQNIAIPLAHTDYNNESNVDYDLMRKIYKDVGVNKKPEHSAIGANICAIIMPHLFSMKPEKNNKLLVDLVSTSILRHHSAFAETGCKYEISQTNYTYFVNLIEEFIPGLSDLKIPISHFLKYEVKPRVDSINFSQSSIAFLYFICVRILRLADQKSFDKNPRKEV